jgi:cytochrome b
MTMDADFANAARPGRQPGWDLPVRLFHWTIVLLIGFSWWSAEQRQLDWHRYSGYAVLTLILFRLAWGFAGSATARFSSFVRGPSAVARYVGRDMFVRTGPTADGHNPVGGWSVLAMLTAMLVQTMLGMVAVDVDGIESGPLSAWVSFDTGRLASKLHGIVFNILLGLVVLHVAAILFYLLYKRANLIGPMVIGRGSGGSAVLGRAAILLLVCAGLVWALVTYGG